MLRPLATTVLIALLGCTTESDPVTDSDTDPVVDTDPVDTPPDTDPVDTPPDDTGGGPSVTVVATPGPTCATPEARATQPYTLRPALDGEIVDPMNTSLFVGGSLTVADLSGDDLLDLVLTHRNASLQLWFGQSDGTFALQADRLPKDLAPRASSATAVDLDDDGDLDLVVPHFKKKDMVLINDGTGSFSTAPWALGMEGEATRRSISSSWADVDGDGVLEGFLAAYGALQDDNPGLPDGDPSLLFQRQPDGTYLPHPDHDWSAPHPLATSHAFQGAFTDADADGDLDLFVVNDFGWTTPTLLLTNEDGVLSHAHQPGTELPYENMGLGLGDLNGDLQTDFLVAAWDKLSLLTSNNGTWYEQASGHSLGTDPDTARHVPWGSELADLDNDGDLDVVQGFGHLKVTANAENPDAQPDAIYLQDDEGHFDQVAETWGMDHPGWTRGVLTVDLNRDGWLEVLVRDLRGATRVYRAACGSNAWLAVEPRQDGVNPFAIGTQVRVVSGDTTWVREVRAGGHGYASAGPPEVHIGLGDRDTVDRVEVRWPDGTWTTLADVPTRQRLQITRHP